MRLLAPHGTSLVHSRPNGLLRQREATATVWRCEGESPGNSSVWAIVR